MKISGSWRRCYQILLSVASFTLFMLRIGHLGRASHRTPTSRTSSVKSIRNW